MALLNKRQQMAAALARELDDLAGVWVDSPLPLADSAKLKVHVLDTERNYFLQTVRDLVFEAVFITIKPRVDFSGMLGASMYEIDLPRERQPIIDDRKIMGEIATSEKSSYERESILRHLGILRVL